VIRRPYQRNIFSEQDTSVKHTVIATNRIESSEQVKPIVSDHIQRKWLNHLVSKKIANQPLKQQLLDQRPLNSTPKMSVLLS
jgi:hypothetical protein